MVDRSVVWWLYTVTLLVVIMVVVGGLTRLTDSGLSITVWEPISGAIPPLNADDWQRAFLMYQQISEYQNLNAGMSMEEFQFIYWWEWGHRQLGRFIGLAFFIPLVWFAVVGKLRGSFLFYMCFLLFLGGFQGFLGWFMVESGVVEDRLDVSAYRLALHLGMAVFLLGLLYHAARTCHASYRASQPSSQKTLGLSYLPVIFLGLLFIQIISGAFVAGTDAGMTYNTWPLMDGAFIPSGLYDVPTPLRAWFEDLRTVQFNHRMLAYIVLIFGCFLVWRLYKVSPYHARVLAVVLLGQVGIGIVTLVTVAAYQHIWLAAFHQLLGIVLYLTAIEIVVYCQNVPHAQRRDEVKLAEA